MNIKLILFSLCLPFAWLQAAVHHGAGVLPYHIDEHGETWLLMGLERSKKTNKRLWCDFGGGPEKGETPLSTAVRESYEETCGLLGEQAELNNRLKEALLLKGLYDRKERYYALYLLRYSPSKDDCATFDARRTWKKYVHKQFQEKHRVAWIPATAVLASLDHNNTTVIAPPHQYPLRHCFFRVLQENAAILKSFLSDNALKSYAHE